MAYILVQPEVLREKGLDFFETMPGGRAIAETNILKVIGSVKEVEFVSTTEELNEIIKREKEELKKKAENEPAEVVPEEKQPVPENADSVPEDKQPAPEEQSPVPEEEEPVPLDPPSEGIVPDKEQQPEGGAPEDPNVEPQKEVTNE